MEWIKCCDQLPAEGIRVLTLDSFGHIRDRVLRKGAEDVFRPDGLIPKRHITHWMPLPEPPKEVAE